MVSDTTIPKKKRGFLHISLASGGKVTSEDLRMGLTLFMPGFLILIFLGTYPIVNVLLLAFQKRSMFGDAEATWVGFQNFVTVLNSEIFWVSLRNDLVFTVVTVIFQTIIGLLVALLLHQNFWGRNVFRSLVLFSYVFPTTVAALVWRFMLSEQVGIIYQTIRMSGLPIPNTWFSSTNTAMATVIMVAVWKFFPFMVINFLARLQTIDDQLYEAAKVDGANPFQAFRHITMPSLMPVVLIVMLLRTIWTFNNWDVIALLTKGGPLDSTRTLPLLVYDSVFSSLSLGRAAATSFVMVLILLAAMIVYLKAYEYSEKRLA